MIKERVPISGDLQSKVKQLMEYAGWQEGRKVDISIAEQHYADHGAPRVNTSKRFSPKHFVLCFQWYLAQKKMGWTADFECVLFSCLTNGIKGHLANIGFGICPAVSWQKSKMTEQYVERAGSGIPKSCPACWRFGRTEKQPGYRFSYCSLGTYKGEQFFDAEQITRNKLCIYTKEKHTGFDRRFLMKRVG